MIILGCGYVGTELARQALAAGESVAALTRNTGKAAELRALGVAPVVVADIAGEDWHAAFDAIDAQVVNCVAPAGAGPEGYRHSFIAGAKSVASWLEKSVALGRPPARELIFTSSTGVYPQTEGEWVEEATPVALESLSAAGTVLREVEEQGLALPGQWVRRVWVMRLGGLYGPGRHQLLDAVQAGEKSFPGGGGHWVNLLYRDDAVAAIRRALTAPTKIAGGVFNVVDNEPVLKSVLVAWLAQRLGRRAEEIQFTPGESTRATHRRSPTGKIPHRRIANVKLRQALGWEPLYPSYRDGYERIIAHCGGCS
jgi:nucleoside-diphosphate-sugar epimerase